MHNNKKEFLASAISLYEYLKIYGDDPHHTKEDLIVLALIRDIVEQNCYFNFLEECIFSNIGHIVMEILHKNPKLKYCRFNLDDYKNLGGKQNITTFRRLNEIINTIPIPTPSWKNVQITRTIVKDDCPPGHYGSTENITVLAGTFTSAISQADANSQANAWLDTNGQALANAQGTCSTIPIYYSAVVSESVQKNDCIAPAVGSVELVSTTLGQFTSMVSQGDANNQAIIWLAANKQDLANMQGTCSLPIQYFNVELSQTFLKNDCSAHYLGSTEIITVAAGTFSSYVSQADADNQAHMWMAANGQKEANARGTCVIEVFYVQLVFDDDTLWAVDLVPYGGVIGLVPPPVVGRTFSHLELWDTSELFDPTTPITSNLTIRMVYTNLYNLHFTNQHFTISLGMKRSDSAIGGIFTGTNPSSDFVSIGDWFTIPSGATMTAQSIFPGDNIHFVGWVIDNDSYLATASAPAAGTDPHAAISVNVDLTWDGMTTTFPPTGKRIYRTDDTVIITADMFQNDASAPAWAAPMGTIRFIPVYRRTN